jgi:hypothetical protein
MESPGFGVLGEVKTPAALLPDTFSKSSSTCVFCTCSDKED